jgi:metal-responsive CopG/Arc/MetJ family transcriptional regulator
MITLYDINMRTIIDLPDTQIQALAQLCQKEKMSRAEAVRTAVAEFLKQKNSPKDFQQAFGLWKNKKINAHRYLSHLRREWD